MSITILDVAKHAGVSRATASRAYTNPEKVKQLTLQRILDSAHTLNYSPNAIARAMKTNKTNNIGFILYSKRKPIISNPFYSLILESIVETSSKKGYGLFISTDQDITLPTGEIMLQNKVDGVILASQIDLKTILTFRKNNVPVVLINNYIDLDGLTCIINDEYYGARQIVKHLVDQGHKKIAIISGSYNPFICNKRYNAYIDVLKENELELNYNYVYSIDPTFEDVFQSINNILIQKDRPTAIFCNSDTIAIYAMKVLIRAGVKIPDDIAVAGFDDSNYCTAIEPELTSVHVDIEKMGHEAVNILHKMICGEEVTEKIIVTKPTLVIRKST